MRPRFVVPLLFALALAAVESPAQDTAAGGLRREMGTSPSTASSELARTLKDAGPNAASLAGPATAAAIRTLGPEVTARQVAAIVFAAVRAVPDSALRIVRAAVAVAPEDAPEIAAAAARAVPNPWKEVRYQKSPPIQETQPAQTAGTYAQNVPGTAGYREPDFKSPEVDNALADILDPAAPGDPMSLAEAIVQAAFDAHSGVSLAAVQGAVDAALFGDPTALFSAVGGVRGISGVGTVGNSNIANEPQFPGPPPTTSTTKKSSQPPPPPPPVPPPVSQ